MNPRVSRSSALASKATGFPIAKIAAKLAVGYTLEEIPNDITRATPASFEPTIDYVVTKVPRFAFEKFPGAEGALTTHMKSVGEAMAIGRTFRESFAKAMRSRELDEPADIPADTDELLARLETPSSDRFDLIAEAFAPRRRGGGGQRPDRDRPVVPARARGAGDRRRRHRRARAHLQVGRHLRRRVRGAHAVLLLGARARDPTPLVGEVRRGDNASVVILGSGPNRIGQGIEFDYCCVHAAMTVRDLGRDAVMINCNPETVSTDYDTSDRLYFEPLTAEDVLAVIEVEQPEGVIVQFGGQTPLRLARTLEEAGVPLLGTPVDAIDLAEDRGRFGALLRRLEIAHPPYGTAFSADEAAVVAEDVGFPLLVRPSYVLGGRAMEICYSAEGLEAYLRANVKADQEHPLLLDRFLEDAIEVDVDALCDGRDVAVAGIMQHVEEAGVHSGDSACVLPADEPGRGDARPDPRDDHQDRARARRDRADQHPVRGRGRRALRDRGQSPRLAHDPVRLQGDRRAARQDRLPPDARASAWPTRTCPATPTDHVSVKEAVLPFARFAGADAVLGPEMKSTGEVMGIARDFPTAFGKAQAAAGVSLPLEGTVFITVTDGDKAAATQLAARFHDLGFRIIATRGTAQAISRMGIPVTAINKIAEGSPHVVDFIRDEEVDLVINTPTGSGARSDGYEIRNAAVRHGIPCVTTMTGASAAARAIFAVRTRGAEPRSLQELHENAVRAPSSRIGRPTRTSRVTERVLAPLGARDCEVVERRETGGYVVFSALDADGPDPAPGQFYMLAAPGWGASGGRPFLPRAFSVADGRARDGGVRLDFLVEAVGPGTAALAALEPGDALTLHGPLGRPFSDPARARRRPPPARSWWAAASGSRRSRSCARRWRPSGVPVRTLLGFRDEAHSGGLELFQCQEVGLAYEDGHAGHRGYVTDLLEVRAEGRRRAVRGRLRVRAAGDARGGADDLRRARRHGRAGDGGADGVRLRRLLRVRGAAAPRAATCGSAWTGRSCAPDEIETALVAGSGHRPRSCASAACGSSTRS